MTRGISGSTMRIDRRQFLQLAAAAGMGTAAACGIAPPVLAQAPSPAADGSLIDDLASMLGNDPERVFAFVRDEIRYEPYVGVLRGATGTLQARAGNSADQASLLAALLRASGVPVRFASGELDGEQARLLSTASVTDLTTARDRMAGSLRRAATPAGPGLPVPPLPSGDIGSPAAMVVEEVQAIGPEVELGIASVATAVEQLQGSLEGAGVLLPDTDQDIPSLERAEHWLVQVQGPTGWEDRSPTFPADAVAMVPSGQPVDELPSALDHRVEISILVERWQGGALVSGPLVEFGARARDLDGVPVVFMNLPAGSVPSVHLFGGGTSGTEYNAALTVGPDTYVGTSTFAVAIPADGGGLFGGDPFGGGGGGLADGETTGEWVEVRVVTPDGQTRVARRAVFDRIGESNRSLASFDPSGIAPAELVRLDGMRDDMAAARTIIALAVAVGGGTSERLLAAGASTPASGLWWVPEAGHVMRDVLSGEAGLMLGADAFLDAPNVIGQTLRFPDEATIVRQYDIWHRSFGTRPISDVRDGPSRRLVIGVLSHVAERLMAGEFGAGSPGRAPSVGWQFEAAAARGATPLVMQGTLPQGAVFPPDAMRRMDVALRAGSILVVPDRPTVVDGVPRIGWWQVDPGTGDVVDVMDDGSGQATTERVESEGVFDTIINCIMGNAEWLTGVMAFVIYALDPGLLNADAKAFLFIVGAMFKLLNKTDGIPGKICDKALSTLGRGR